MSQKLFLNINSEHKIFKNILTILSIILKVFWFPLTKSSRPRLSQPAARSLFLFKFWHCDCLRIAKVIDELKLLHKKQLIVFILIEYSVPFQFVNVKYFVFFHLSMMQWNWIAENLAPNSDQLKLHPTASESRRRWNVVLVLDEVNNTQKRTLEYCVDILL